MIRPPTHARQDDETTPELTGADARPEEAARGDAGNGASPWGGDLPSLGGAPDDEEPMRSDLFEESVEPRDIVPDHIEDASHLQSGARRA